MPRSPDAINLARVRNRAFITVTIMVPAFMAMYIVAMPAMTRSGRTSLRLAIVELATGLGPALVDRLKAVERPQITIVEVAASAAADEAQRARFTAAVQDRSLDG